VAPPKAHQGHQFEHADEHLQTKAHSEMKI
jgi:hypothetical protein